MGPVAYCECHTKACFVPQMVIIHTPHGAGDGEPGLQICILKLSHQEIAQRLPLVAMQSIKVHAMQSGKL